MSDKTKIGGMEIVCSEYLEEGTFVVLGPKQREEIQRQTNAIYKAIFDNMKFACGSE